MQTTNRVEESSITGWDGQCAIWHFFLSELRARVAIFVFVVLAYDRIVEEATFNFSRSDVSSTSKFFSFKFTFHQKKKKRKSSEIDRSCKHL